ncbi:Site-specific recombinase XerD [Congregibacter litoralis KT71]|uniref:Site-specific recombinase XerD n=2 Tax=Congregibacter TaxID=393661 RepID=A4A8F9_9GAMM|nr:Site-specific recombinase XerD [Congregibacter litoralis KT71]
MIEIERRFVDYESVDTGLKCSHHLLVAQSGDKNVLLSHPNLFLYENASSSKNTSNRYSNVIAMFYRFLSGEEKYRWVDVSQYHALADNNDIKRWQVARQEERLLKNQPKPSSQTIYGDAKLLLIFFEWLVAAGFVTCVNVKTKTWSPNFKREGFLNYVRKESREVIDPKNIEVLDKEWRQARLHSLITNQEIKALIVSYHDPVYPALFKFALGTAMRPMDLVRFPYIGNGPNKHILPYSDMAESESNVVDYTVEKSKGGKTREIKMNRADLRALDEHYIKPYYHERAKLYEQRYGEKCPPSILFLNRFGEPVTPKMISDATTDAKAKAKEIHPEFRNRVNFYEARHWWPTMFLIRFFEDKLLTEAADALYAAAAEVLKSQMGHQDLATTYKYYVDKARLVVMANQGMVNEIITDQDVSVEQFIEEMEASV